MGSLSIKGQMRPPLNILSPNAASLNQYNDIPVSKFTGIPQIDLPLFSTSEDNINLPISLNYHASGIKMDQHPGSLGLNWSLSTLYSINRKVNDIKDELPNGYYFKHNITTPVNWDTKNYLIAVAKGNKSSDNKGNYDNNYLDTEPDEFSFQFLNYQGKFFSIRMGYGK